uniref:Transcriptional regulator, XRE family n=1 Tax=Solibacter usitatus (strain Ellin6076) TaxID=234267 RepID=Q023X0_SOLUE
MTFDDLRARLISNLRLRVRSGEVTERSLARLTGVSQPHLHHILKGKRKLSLEMADLILRRLDMSVVDLLSPEELRERRPHR